MRILLLLTLVALVGLNGAQNAGTITASDCGSNPADIHFLLDSSGSVGSSNFRKQLQFVARFAQAFHIGPHNVQIGVTTFASIPHNEFNMNVYQNNNDLVHAINQIRYHSGGTRTDLALKYVEANSFRPESGARPGVSDILIVITDGKSNQPTLTVQEADKLHLMYIKVFAIGIGSGVDKAELNYIASDSHHVFQVQNFDALHTLQAELQQTACNTPPCVTITDCPHCHDFVDPTGRSQPQDKHCINGSCQCIPTGV